MAAKRRRDTQRGRFRNAADAQDQTLDLEKVKRALRKGKGVGRVIIDSDAKSEQRFRNKLREIRDAEDAFDQFT